MGISWFTILPVYRIHLHFLKRSTSLSLFTKNLASIFPHFYEGKFFNNHIVPFLTSLNVSTEIKHRKTIWKDDEVSSELFSNLPVLVQEALTTGDPVARFTRYVAAALSTEITPKCSEIEREKDVRIYINVHTVTSVPSTSVASFSIPPALQCKVNELGLETTVHLDRLANRFGRVYVVRWRGVALLTMVDCSLHGIGNWLTVLV